MRKKNLEPETCYQFRSRVKDGVGWSTFGAVFTGKTASLSALSERMEAPTAAAVTHDSVTLEWKVGVVILRVG